MRRLGKVIVMAGAFAWAAFAPAALGQRTDLSGLKFCIDPGHGGYDSNDRHVVPDPGTDFWESESNWFKALHLKGMLEERGATVFLTRNSNTEEPDLLARAALANANNVNWFHSIHSNATGWVVNNTVNYTLLLVKEDIPTRQPAFPEAVVMSDLIGPSIQSKIRTQPRGTYTYLDYTFYGGPNGGFNLGVLRTLTMPGQLSEGSFHDHFPETRRLMNNTYRKMEAYAIRNAFMQYYGVPADTLGMIAGIQTNIAGGAPVNYTRVRLLPVNRVADGDRFNNGFYMFDSLTAGTYTVRFETPWYTVDSAVVTLSRGQTRFLDRTLTSFAAPAVVTASPAKNDSTVLPNRSVTLSFSKPMDTSSVRSAFSMSPAAPGRMTWGTNNTVMTYDPDSVLQFYVWYTVRIEGTARAQDGQFLDGNGDGTGGDAYVLPFKTTYADVFPPALVTEVPESNAVFLTPDNVLNFTFDERLNPATVTIGNFAVQEIGGSLQARAVLYSEDRNRGGVTVQFPNGLKPGKSYRLRVSGVADVSGNAIQTTSAIWRDFSVSPATYTSTMIDSLTGPLASWPPPAANPNTEGVDSVKLDASTARRFPITATSGTTARLRYWWNPASAEKVIDMRFAPSGAAPSWTKARNVVQLFVHGDGGNALVRFMLRDSSGSSASPTIEYAWSQVHRVDWIGWRLVEWDLENEPPAGYTGDGLLDGVLTLESIQVTHDVSTTFPSGTLYFARAQTAERAVTGVGDEAGVPDAFALEQNFPNPFNPTTVISYQLPVASQVKIVVYDLLGRQVATLVDGQMTAGRHDVTFDAGRLSSGVYVYRLTAGGRAASRKMILTK